MASQTNQQNLTRRSIVSAVFQQTGYKRKEIRDIIQVVLDSIVKALSEGRNVELRKFGVFELQQRRSRIGRNPNKPQNTVLIPARAVVKFKAGKELQSGLAAFDLDKFKGNAAAVAATAAAAAASAASV